MINVLARHLKNFGHQTRTSISIFPSVLGAVLVFLLAVVLVAHATAQAIVPAPVSMAYGPVANTRVPKGAVLLEPGDNIGAIVRRLPPGTNYFLQPGIYRLQQIFPKDGDSFTGARGATLNGARQLKAFDVSGGLYVARNQAPHPMAERVGMCRPEFPRCDRPESLYFDGRPLRAVSQLSEVGAGKWYFDYLSNNVYFFDAPDGHIIELSYTPFAFGGTGRDVTISNLIVENYASANQQGAINNHGGGSGWKVAHNDVRWNHGYGIVVGTSNKVLSNNIHHNGQIGLGGGGTHHGWVEGNVIAFNVWNGVNCEWECGGAKWGNVKHLTVVGNYVHNNEGNGLWTDERSSEILFESNLIENNLLAGISHEISHSALIRNNVLQGNGAQTYRWGWHAQIQIQNSTDTEVSNNTIILDPVRGGNGITVIQQERGAEFKPRNVFIHDNSFTMKGGEGALVGWFAEGGTGGFLDANNRFDYNHYHIAAPVTRHVWAANAFDAFAAWQASGSDRNGTVDSAVATDP